MAASQNIVVLLTPPGSGAIAVVRLRGPGVLGFLQRHFTRPAALGRSVHGNLTDSDRVIDDAVVVLSGNEVVDLNVHGGNWVVRSVLDLAVREGFDVLDGHRVPLAPESLDASTLLEREVLAYLPMARTELGLRTLLAQQAAWEQLRARHQLSPGKTRGELRAALGDRALDHLLNPPTVAIVGPANVGKSTLANQLFAQERSITADVPGTTRDCVGELANIDGLPVVLLDTPGLRQTQDPIETTAIDRSLLRIDRAELVVVVLDAARPLAGEQSRLLDAYPDAMRVINKCDRPKSADLADLASFCTIATTGKGIGELRVAIVEHFCGEFPVAVDRPRCWTPRHRDIAGGAAEDFTALDELFMKNPALYGPYRP